MRPLPAVASVVAVVVTTLTGACDDGARDARRDAAHDLAGTWSGAWRNDDDDDDDPSDQGVLTLVVDNEADKNDVVVKAARDDASAAEAPFIARIDDDGFATALVLGAGNDAARDETDGGENVSVDGGVTSSLAVSSVDLDAEVADVSGPAAQGSVVRWTLLVRTDDDDADRLVGVLQVSLLERRERGGERDGFETVSEQAAVDVDVRRE